jgi:hypothetical protein
VTVAALGVALGMVAFPAHLGGQRPAQALLAPDASASRRGPVPPQESEAQRRLTAAMAAVTAALANADPGAVPSNLTPSLRAAHRDRSRPFDDGCHSGFLSAAVERCIYGNASGATTVVGFGDSHATMWFPALEAMAASRGWRYESFGKSTCPPAVLPPIWSPDLGHMYPACSTWRQAVLARIASERPALVVVMTARHYGGEFKFEVYSRMWLEGLSQTVAQLRATGARVVVLGPVPKAPGDIPDCLAEHLNRVSACEASPAQEVNADGVAAERAAVTAAGATYVDVTPWFCTTTRCPVVVGNTLVYRDDNHITTAYAEWLGPVLDATLNLQALRD